jgi:hypothetical protein
MSQEKVAARISQVNEQLALIEKKRDQFAKFLEQIPEDDPSRSSHEQAFRQNGNDELIELLHEKAKLSYVLDPNQRNIWNVSELATLITPDIRAEAYATIKDFEAKFGMVADESCSIGRCVQCVMCPSTCAGMCQNCVHCPPNGVVHRP